MHPQASLEGATQIFKSTVLAIPALALRAIITVNVFLSCWLSFPGKNLLVLAFD
jgi:hypothetical protein